MTMQRVTLGADAGRHAHGDAPHEHVEHVDARGLGRAGDVSQTRMLYDVPERRDAVRSGEAQRRLADVHARARRIDRHVRARERDGRAGVRARRWIRSRCASRTTRSSDPESEQAVVEQVAARMLRLGGREVRLEQAQSEAALDARRAVARRLGHGDGDVSRARDSRRARRAQLLPDGRVCVRAGHAGDRLRHVHGR